MDTPKNTELDINAWVQLYKTDPEAFEAKRLEWIENIINQAPESMQRRLRGLQFQIDAERMKSKNAYGSCIRLLKKMFEHLGLLQEALQGKLPPAQTTEATILPFETPNPSSDT